MMEEQMEARALESEASREAEIDMEAAALLAERRADKKRLAVFASLLEQQGVEGGASREMAERWLEERAGQRSGELEELRRANRTLERRLLAAERGIPRDKVDKYLRLAQVYLGDAGDFAQALQAAVEDCPLSGGGELPSFAAGMGPGGGKLPLTREQIDRMTPQQLADRWDEVEDFLQR